MLKLGRLFHFVRSHCRWVGLTSAIPFIIDRLLRRKRFRNVMVAGVPLVVRTNSPDLAVAASCLLEGEYSHLQAQDPKVIVDAGANIGTSSIAFARRWPKATIYAIEPEEENFSLLVRNTAPFPNIVPIKSALWGREESRYLLDRQTGPWGYTLADAGSTGSTTAAAIGSPIDCMTIGSLLRDRSLDRIDLLKIDIEGGEKSVLESSSEWIDRVDVLTAELHDRICMGCDRAFYLATQSFSRFEKHGEKVTAYRAA